MSDDTTTTPISAAQQTPPAPPPPAATPSANADKIAAAKAAVVTAKAKIDDGKAAAAAAAESTRTAALTDAQKTEEAHKALRAELDADRAKIADERKALIVDARRTAVERLGITSKAFALVPDVDPRTPEGAQSLETWAKANPEFLTAKPVQGYVPPTPPAESRLGKLLAGTLKNPFMSAEQARAMLAKIR